mmetsp:Transcript_3761/g.15253  ORF Transcript_3761/g.15253 Transcript_3761/m.15253 type:complete len:228 (+) Transcript_3761:1066-1749(+)
MPILDVGARWNANRWNAYSSTPQNQYPATHAKQRPNARIHRQTPPNPSPKPKPKPKSPNPSSIAKRNPTNPAYAAIGSHTRGTSHHGVRVAASAQSLSKNRNGESSARGRWTHATYRSRPRAPTCGTSAESASMPKSSKSSSMSPSKSPSKSPFGSESRGETRLDERYRSVALAHPGSTRRSDSSSSSSSSEDPALDPRRLPGRRDPPSDVACAAAARRALTRANGP